MSGLMPTITAIVATYNYAHFLPAALDSLLGQDPPFAEIIVVDDGSTDETPRLLAERYPQLQVLRTENQGQLGACFAGLALAHGEYIYFLDADDRAAHDLTRALASELADRPDKLQFQLRAMDMNGVAQASIFPTYPARYTAAEARHDNDMLGFYICPPTSGAVHRAAVLRSLDASVLAKREAIDGVPTLVLPYLGSLRSLNRPLADYRVHDGSDSQWGRPTSALLQRELDLFESRWRQVAALLGKDPRRLADAPPAYVTERRMMLDTMSGRASSLHTVLNYVWSMRGSHLPPKQKTILLAWAVAFFLAPSRLRHAAVHARRSPSSRPRFLDRLLRGRRHA